MKTAGSVFARFPLTSALFILNVAMLLKTTLILVKAKNFSYSIVLLLIFYGTFILLERQGTEEICSSVININSRASSLFSERKILRRKILPNEERKISARARDNVSSRNVSGKYFSLFFFTQIRNSERNGVCSRFIRFGSISCVYGTCVGVCTMANAQ